MPHEQDRLSSESEQLSRKIERLIAGQPSPVLNNPDTEDLAELAAMLQRYLAKDLPDPEFRTQLKEDLINPHPRLVSFPRRSRPRRYPVPMFAGALAFAVIAAVATGWMVFGSGDDSLNLAAKSGSLAGTATATPRTAAFGVVPTAAATDAITGIAPSDTRETAPADATSVPAEETPEAASEDSAGYANDDPEEQAEPPLAASPTPSPTSIMMQVSTTPAPIDLPPIDTAHVELGALATVTGDSAPAVEEVTYTLENVDLPELEGAAPAYRFSTPHVQPELIVSGVAEFLGFDEENVEMVDYQGRTVYSLGSPDSDAKFTFSPTTGAFSCTVPESHASDDIEDLSKGAIEWLQKFGYPVDDGANPIIKTLPTGQREVHIPVDELPDTIVGHPMTVSLVIDPEGRVIRVSGYWLEKIEQSDLTLLTPEQAWAAIVAGQGYWPEGNAPTEPGEFRVSSLSLTYMLTVDDDSQLVLQPVISASGMFHPTDGSESTTGTVYLQAAAQA